VDIYWYIGSQLDLLPETLPIPSSTLTGKSIVPLRYHFNTGMLSFPLLYYSTPLSLEKTKQEDEDGEEYICGFRSLRLYSVLTKSLVTFSYTAAFWSWEDWELQLDSMALRGINLPLAWVGMEQIYVEVFREVGLTDDEIDAFLSGPAFQAWNRFGNIQGSWGGSLPLTWVDRQFQLQKKIVQRMVELGMVPVLPCFAGFVPPAITRVFPNATVVNGSQWSGFPEQYTEDTFLEPLDPLFAQLQKSFISKQQAAYGNISNIYTLDQYNENNPYSDDLGYLQNVSSGTWKSLKEADPEAVWMMQGWLFYSNSAFWTNDRIEAYLGGVEDNDDMLILDLFSESQPQWQRTNSYFGKPWIWCQLHDYGGNMGLYGQVMNITINPIEALANSTNLIGFGLTMEGQEGNEIVYDLLLDQAWNPTPIETESYFADWVSSRYNHGGRTNSQPGSSSPNTIPQELYTAWDLLRTTVYNNTNLTAATAVVKSILELEPAISGLVNRTGHHPTTLTYDPAVVNNAWTLSLKAGSLQPSLYANSAAFQYDIVDVTRQVLSNAFLAVYTNLTTTWQSSPPTKVLSSTGAGTHLLALLQSLDLVLSTNHQFSLSTWLDDASTSADSSSGKSFFAFQARNQLTLWGPTGQISDYASKSWGGLVGSYYLPRWRIFLEYLDEVGSVTNYNATELHGRLLEFEESWQESSSSSSSISHASSPGSASSGQSVEEVLGQVYDEWKSILAL
jgi:alpha-N-acetylglucosaminidase